MTVPTNIIFPVRVDLQSNEDINRYLKDLVYELQTMYEQLAQGVNGDIKASAFTDSEKWTPTMAGTTTAGTFTYTHQTGWVLRQGIMTDIWFDVAWTNAGAAAGNLYLTLPYKVARSDNIPFSSAIQTSTLNYGAGKSVLSINGIPNTFRGEIWSSGSAAVTANVAVAAAGRVIGHLRYMGEQNES